MIEDPCKASQKSLKFVKKSCLKMTWHCKNNSLLVKKVDTLTMSIKEIVELLDWQKKILSY